MENSSEKFCCRDERNRAYWEAGGKEPALRREGGEAGQGVLRRGAQPARSWSGLGKKPGTGEKGTSVDAPVPSERPSHQCGVRRGRRGLEGGQQSERPAEREGPGSG